MNITVCIKQVPGTTEVEVDEVTGVLKREGVESKMNPYDLFAIETAVRIKHSHGATVSAISMGPPQAAQVIHEAFMMGVDSGVLLTDRKFAGADVLATSYALSQGIQHNGIPDLILCGKMTTDGDTAQVGPEVAEFLGIPHIANVLRILEIKEASIVVEMDMAATVEVAEVQFPCLLTVEKDIYPPRLPSFRLKLATHKIKIPHIGLNDLADKEEIHYGLNGSPTQVKRIFPPPVNTDHEIWKDTGIQMAERLAAKLKEMKFT